MRNSFLILLLVLGCPALAQEGRTVLRVEEETLGQPSRRPYSLDFDLELRAQRDERLRPANRSQEALQELSFGGAYRFDPAVAVRMELAMEQLEGEATFIAKEAYVEWTPFKQYVRTRLGQQFLPVGMVNERDMWFSSNPPWMRKLFAESKGIDLGAVVSVAPLGRDWVSAEAGAFSGRFVRAEDQRRENPQKTPRLASLKSHSRFHDAFATYFEHDLAVYDPIKAWGAGFEVRAPEWTPSGLPAWSHVNARLLAEFWRIDQLQRVGPNQENRVAMVYGELRWWRLGVGHRYSVSRGEIVSAVARDRLTDEVSKLTHFDVQIADVFSLRAERVIETQDLVLRDEWVGRALVKWEL